MAMPEFTMRQLLEAAVHFGHQTHRWNPKMENYIFGDRNGIHILDLSQTVPALQRGLQAISDTVARGGRVLFVGTKRQAAEPISDAAKRCAQYYMNQRWLGGTLTNWKTITNSINRLRDIEEMANTGQVNALTKKERLNLQREKDKLEMALGGIKDMGGLPDILFIIDTNKEAIAIQEANRLNIPVVAIIDSNSDPKGITYPIPGNDDAGRAIALYCDLVAKAALDGISRSGVAAHDAGADVEPVFEALPEAVEAELSMASLGDTTFEKLAEPKGEKDDLKKISGVGPVIEEKLNKLGIFHFWQVAQFSQEDIAKVDDVLSFKGRIERDNWLEQAKEMSAGNSAA